MNLPLIQLPPIEPERLAYQARRIRASTSVGGDWIRLAHIARLSRAALLALANWFHAIEKVCRWPTVVRSVIEVALQKKAGGARLIGMAASVYRLWARVRYQDIRAQLEPRLARAELAAAPGRGASQAAFDAAYTTEVAVARGKVAATTAIDLSQYYEHISVAEFIKPAMKVGLPAPIAALTAHFYLGPRRLRVGRAFSPVIYPRRGIVAGCTWCTVIIRIIILVPLDQLLWQFRSWARGWDVEFLTTVYIDDAMVTTFGNRNNVELIHVWATEYVLGWIRGVLRKMVSVPKLQCVSADAEVRKTLRRRLKQYGFRVTKVGDMLGTDFGGGAPLRRRRLQEKRRRKALARRCKLKWWAKAGGDAHHVVETGLEPSAIYGMAANGIPPTVMRDVRRLRGAFARIKCGGASLTAKLATAGRNFAEADPAVIHAAPSLKSILAMIWDFPRTRSGFVFAWRRAVREVKEGTENGWRAVAGPVGAAMCQLTQIGVNWPAPFRLQWEDITISILDLPPSKYIPYCKTVHALHSIVNLLIGWPARRGGTRRRCRTSIHMG